jgi:hypothetical protein
MDAWLTWLWGHLVNAGLAILIVVVVVILVYLVIEGVVRVIFFPK